MKKKHIHNDTLFYIEEKYIPYIDRLDQFRYIYNDYFEIKEDNIIQLENGEFTSVNHIFYDMLSQCGCGDAESRFKLIKAILQLKEITLPNVIKELKKDMRVTAELVIGFLDGLLEHGSSCHYNWLTELGKALNRTEILICPKCNKFITNIEIHNKEEHKNVNG